MPERGDLPRGVHCVQNDTYFIIRTPIFGIATTRKGSRKDGVVILSKPAKDRLERQNMQT